MHSRQWYYVNTKINPADMASRGMLANELVENNLWWHGPKLTDLKFKAEHDISADNKSKAESEMKKPNCFLVKNSCNFLVDDISSHFNHKRVFKNICKFISIIYKRIIENKGKQCDFNDRINRFKNYEYVLLQLVQISEFQEEINCIKSKLPLPKTSSLRSLNPFLDGHDILRVGGRLQNSTLSFSQKHPIILPYGHQVTKNIIREAHENLLHGGLKLTASYIRNRFYIVRGLRLIKSILNGCIKCVRFKHNLQSQLMGSLPSPRVNQYRTFLHSGVDYAGPFTLKAWKGRCNKQTKAYVAVFVCLSTKAIHIELVSDLSSECFLAAFKRFSSRRGRIQCLYSDQGTNFKGASKLLEIDCMRAQNTWNKELSSSFDKMCTKWNFIPPAYPHFGGLWEAGVKSIKTHLVKTIGNACLTFEEFSTLLVQIEGVLNSRPLSPLTDNPEDYSALTPAHFLIGEPIVSPPEGFINPDTKSGIKRWQYIQKLRQNFWLQWKSEYIHRLQRRPKWLNANRNLIVNDLVIITDERYPPTQ